MPTNSMHELSLVGVIQNTEFAVANQKRKYDEGYSRGAEICAPSVRRISDLKKKTPSGRESKACRGAEI